MSGIPGAAPSALPNTTSPERAIVIIAASPPASGRAPQRDYDLSTHSLAHHRAPSSLSYAPPGANSHRAGCQFSRSRAARQARQFAPPPSKSTPEFDRELLPTLILAPDLPTPHAVAQRLGVHPIRLQRTLSRARARFADLLPIPPTGKYGSMPRSYASAGHRHPGGQALNRRWPVAAAAPGRQFTRHGHTPGMPRHRMRPRQKSLCCSNRQQRQPVSEPGGSACTSIRRWRRRQRRHRVSPRQVPPAYRWFGHWLDDVHAARHHTGGRAD